MEAITTDSLSSGVYELIQHGMQISIPKVKAQFREWALNDRSSNCLLELVASIPTEKKQSEKTIEEHISASNEWKQLLEEIAQEASNRAASATLSISATKAAVTKKF